MTENELRRMARQQILSRFEKKKTSLVQEASETSGGDVTLVELREMVRDAVLRRFLEKCGKASDV